MSDFIEVKTKRGGRFIRTARIDSVEEGEDHKAIIRFSQYDQAPLTTESDYVLVIEELKKATAWRSIDSVATNPLQ